MAVGAAVGVADGAGDVVGFAADTASTPYGYVLPFYVTLSANVVRLVNLRSLFLEEVAESRETAVDYYVFMRNAYLHHRRLLIHGEQAAQPEDEDDLYYFDEDEE